MSRGGEAAVAERIHNASLALLDEPGVRLEHDEICQMLIKNGARAGASAHVVRIPKGMVEECLARCPKRVCARQQEGRGAGAVGDGGAGHLVGAGAQLEPAGRVSAVCEGATWRRWRGLLDQLDQVDVVFGDGA